MFNFCVLGAYSCQLIELNTFSINFKTIFIIYELNMDVKPVISEPLNRFFFKNDTLGELCIYLKKRLINRLT